MSDLGHRPRNKTSKRFDQSFLTNILIPLILIILALGLLATIVFVILFAIGII